MLPSRRSWRRQVNDTIAVQNALIAAGVSIKEEDGRAIAEMVVRNRELKRSVYELTRAEEEKQRTAKKAAEEQRRVVERSTDDVVRYAGDAFADLCSETGRGWRGMWYDMCPGRGVPWRGSRRRWCCGRSSSR